MITVIEDMDKPQSYSWGMLHPGDVIKNTKWKAENDYALVIGRTEDQVDIFRFSLGARQIIRPTDCPGDSFYKYNADFVITGRV